MASASSMNDHFERQRVRLTALALRMLGSRADADDALQETWIRANRVDIATIDNPAGWLTTVTARVCLNALRSRALRHEGAVDAVPEPAAGGVDPSHEAVLADAVGLALLVVLDTLSPAERVAFVLHDMFAVPFEEIAPIVDRSVESTRQLASRARRRVQPAAGPTIEAKPDPDPSRRRQLVDAFFAAARRGDLDALIAVLDPEIVLTADRGLAQETIVSGAAPVAGRATMFAKPDAILVPVLVDDHPAVIVDVADRTIALMVFTVAHDSLVAIEVVTDQQRLATIRRL